VFIKELIAEVSGWAILDRKGEVCHGGIEGRVIGVRELKTKAVREHGAGVADQGMVGFPEASTSHLIVKVHRADGCQNGGRIEGAWPVEFCLVSPVHAMRCDRGTHLLVVLRSRPEQCGSLGSTDPLVEISHPPVWMHLV
jgi:hypothetical protein